MSDQFEEGDRPSLLFGLFIWLIASFLIFVTKRSTINGHIISIQINTNFAVILQIFWETTSSQTKQNPWESGSEMRWLPTETDLCLRCYSILFRLIKSAIRLSTLFTVQSSPNKRLSSLSFFWSKAVKWFTENRLRKQLSEKICSNIYSILRAIDRSFAVFKNRISFGV